MQTTTDQTTRQQAKLRIAWALLRLVLPAQYTMRLEGGIEVCLKLAETQGQKGSLHTIGVSVNWPAETTLKR